LSVSLGIAARGSELAVNLVVCHSGEPSAAESDVGQIRALGNPVADTIAWQRYLDMQLLFAETFPYGSLNYWKSSFLGELGDGAIETLIDAFASAPSPHVSVSLEHLGGAFGRIATDATAFGERDANHNLIVIGCWTDPAESERNIDWIRSTWQAMRPFIKDSAYSNYLDAGDEGRANTAYGANLPRLAQIKARYDPDNLFRHNQNILPAG
jgi:FAD/FMN-containing dehydrogenase